MPAILTTAILFLLPQTADTAGNILVDPDFEDWTNAWTRAGTHAASTQWDSRWINRTDGRTGAYILAVKHPEMEPFDDTTPVDVLLFQDVARITPGEWEASLWFKAGGEGAMWDGPGGADQWTRIVVYLWADEDRIQLVGSVLSPKIEVPVAEWHRFAVKFTAPDSVKSASLYCFARLVDRWPRAWAAWDDPYLGPAVKSEPARPSNLISLDSFEVAGNPSNVSLEPDGTLKVTHSSVDSTFAVKMIPFDCAQGARRIRVSVECKAEDVVRGKQPWYGLREIIWFLGPDGRLLPHAGLSRSDVIPCIAGSRDWTRYEQTLVIPQRTSKLKAEIGIDHCSGTALFRNLQIQEVFDDYLIDESPDVTIDIGEHISTMLEGFGWNWETVTPARHHASEIALWPELFERMAWDGPEMLRVGVAPGMCPPKEYEQGADTGQHFTYDFDTPPVRNLCRLLEFCDSHGIDVLLANWSAGFGSYTGVPNGDWLQKGRYDGKGSKNPDWQTPYSKDRMADYLAELAYYFRVTRGYRCVKYLSVWNEPGYWNDIDQYPESFLEIYALLDAKLRARALRDRIRLVGLEMVEGGESIGKTVDILRAAPYIDVAAVHDYSAGLGVATATTHSYPLDNIISATVPQARAFRAMRKGGVPVMMTETNGMGTTGIYSERDQFIACLGAVEYAVELVKTGFCSVLKWQYNQPGRLQFCPFRFDDGHARPNNGTYYPWALLSRWTVRNSAVLDTRVTGGLDESASKRVRSVALRSPKGEMTIVVVNDGRLSKNVKIQASGKTQWRHFFYDGTLPDFPRESKDLKPADGFLRAVAPPESVNILTTFPTGLDGAAPR